MKAMTPSRKQQARRAMWAHVAVFLAMCVAAGFAWDLWLPGLGWPASAVAGCFILVAVGVSLACTGDAIAEFNAEPEGGDE